MYHVDHYFARQVHDVTGIFFPFPPRIALMSSSSSPDMGAVDLAWQVTGMEGDGHEFWLYYTVTQNPSKTIHIALG